MVHLKAVKYAFALLISIPLLSSCAKEEEVAWTEKVYTMCLTKLTDIGINGFDGTMDEKMLKSLNTVTALTCNAYQSKCQSNPSDSECGRFIRSLEHIDK